MKFKKLNLSLLLSFSFIACGSFASFNNYVISNEQNSFKLFRSEREIKRNIINYTEPIDIKVQNSNDDLIDLKKVLTNLSIIVKGNKNNMEINKNKVFDYLNSNLRGNFSIYKSKYTNYIFVDFMHISSEDYKHNERVINYNTIIKNAFLTKKTNFENLKVINAYGSTLNISNIINDNTNIDKLELIGLNNTLRNEEIEKNTRKFLANSNDRIKIGVLDDGQIETNHYFDQNTIKITNKQRFWGWNNNYGEHATKVGSIISGKWGVNPLAHLYGIRAFSYNGISQEIEWLIEQGVKLINISLKFGDNFEYDSIANYLDKLQNNDSYEVTIINSAGNDGKKTNHKLKSNALSFNSVTVGALKGTSYSIADYSSYARNTDDKRPTLVAPGNFVFSKKYTNGETFFNESGTSYAAPIVTGVLSLAMQNKPGIFSKGKDNLISISALSTSADTYGSDVNSKTHGAGILNYNNLLKALDNIHYIKLYGWENRAINKDDMDVKTVYLKKGQTIKSSLVWNFKNKFETAEDNSWGYDGYPTGQSSDVISKPLIHDFDFRIKDSSGSVVKSSTSVKNNIEIVSYTASADGYYKLQINQYHQVERNEVFDLAVSYLIK